MILGGGGQDTGQKKIIDDLFARADDLRRFAADGVPMLMICGCTSCSAITSRQSTAPGSTASASSAPTPSGATCA